MLTNWRYAWNNSADPRIVRAHSLVDAAVELRPAVVRSAGSPDAPVFAYGGLSRGVVHVLDFLEQRRGGVSARTERRSTWPELVHAEAVPDTDILAVGLPVRRIPARLPARSVLAPLRITLSVPVGRDFETVLGRISRKARQQYARELVARERTLEVASSAVDFDHFYDGMHRPTMAVRHGAAARSESRRTAWACLFRRGVLFFLCESGRRTAGMLCRLDGRTLVIRLAGVEGGGSKAYESATYLALYIMIFRWAAGHGVTRVDLSGCEPFLSKGLFQFKRKMHPEVTLPANHFGEQRLLLRVVRDRPAVRDFLVANPMLTMSSEDGFEAVYFHDEQRPARSDLRWECPGVTGKRLVHLDEFLAGRSAVGRQPRVSLR
ncbi:hypothetical protein SAMN05421837_102803 [Amycolatopsis pretoriensis]|uniref:Acetyltransferase (GNAT) domain-containing protein n=1 Tax=Amycolatopsis pretoriensis TaxID=218821 RepID=A0A1H5QF65_9PSEU|nr:hypothetical protein [Amycolatopsis pretoriensis]SEF24649.1 hypothetical protein SAMN05421837_102803 [Amycolatopsis pretoriensis]